MRFTEQQLAAIRSLCRTYGVRGLWAFGSATRRDFDPATSDVDLIVDFGDSDPGPWASRFFQFQGALEAIFQRPVDLVSLRAVSERPSFAAVDKGKVSLYAAA